MSSLFVDLCPRYQPTTNEYGYYSKLRKLGVKGAFVQTTYGNYPDPTPATEGQINNSLKYFKWCGCYQFFLGDPVLEANYFSYQLSHNYHMDKSTPVMLDVEGSRDYDAQFAQTHLINQWIDKMYNAGYHTIVIYTMYSFIKSGYVKPQLLHHHAILWVANYGVDEPGVNNAGAWQYTDNFCGLDTDGNYWFKPLSILTGQSNKLKHTTKEPSHKTINKPRKIIKRPVKQTHKTKPDVLSGTFKVTGKIERLK